VLSVADRDQKMLFGSCFPVALLRNLADFATGIQFCHEKPEHANAPYDRAHYCYRNLFIHSDAIRLGFANHADYEQHHVMELSGTYRSRNHSAGS